MISSTCLITMGIVLARASKTRMSRCILPKAGLCCHGFILGGTVYFGGFLSMPPYVDLRLSQMSFAWTNEAVMDRRLSLRSIHFSRASAASCALQYVFTCLFIISPRTFCPVPINNNLSYGILHCMNSILCPEGCI